MGELSADTYFRKIESIVTLLNYLGPSMSDDDIVTYAINGLSEKFTNLATIIAHKDPFSKLRLMYGNLIGRLHGHLSKAIIHLVTGDNTACIPDNQHLLLLTSRVVEVSNG